ncbi:hypothetical protein [Oligoflexus tunisiensis]|uniref:hypothetical protein n=1 Tax=Oligoflexus tunisiensis TaxID=708132 RepID=UPI00114CD18B|nr:hypothetical protein [Oligoflexus tunisiensis]
MQSMKALILCLGMVGSLQACMPSGFLETKPKSAASQQAVLDPKTQSNDRPTETGAGVPGYLVNCTDMNAAGELVQVGCSVADSSGKRVQGSADIWNRYEIKLSPSANPNIKVSKESAAAGTPWDVIFAFTGAPLAELRLAAMTSTYSYSQPDDKGETVTVETPPVVAPPSVPALPYQSCPNGVLVEGICFVTVFTSCTTYCSNEQLTVHPWVVERYGSGAAGNREACAQLYKKFPDYIPIIGDGEIRDVTTILGLGCHRAVTGQAFFDSTPTDPSKAPFLGYSRICACQ